MRAFMLHAAIICSDVLHRPHHPHRPFALRLLHSYATTDPLAFIARLGICASIIFSYPLNFVGLRDGVLNMLGLSGAASKPSVHILATVALLCAVNGLALVVKDLGLVVSIGGALLGSALVYVFPAAMFIQATRNLSKKLQERGESLPAGRRNEMCARQPATRIKHAASGVRAPRVAS